MVYNYKQHYEHIFDTPAKKQQEMCIAKKIMELLNNNKYDSIYEFVTKNQTYQDFLKNNEMENVVKHFGNTLSEEDFRLIQDQIIKITEKMKTSDKENVKTTHIDGQEFVSFEGENKDYFFDNSHSNMTIEREMDELQKTQRDFQTTDTKQNSENIMQEMENEKKESLNLCYIHEIDVSKLNEKQKEIFDIVVNYQLDNPKPIRVDLDRGIIVDSENAISKVEKNNGEFSITSENEEKSQTEEKKEEKTFQKSLTPSLNTIYSANN